MTDLSGIESNKTFKTGILPGQPYYYINAHLDLSQVAVPSNGDITLYFNKDNTFDYLDPLIKPNYFNYHTIDENAVIGEVVVYSNPQLTSSESNILFNVGGAVDTESPVTQTWGGQTGYTAQLLTLSDINTSSICYYGHEGGVNNAKYLAVTISSFGLITLQENEKQRVAKRKRNLKVVVPPTFTSGSLHVVVKVYPKYK